MYAIDLIKQIRSKFEALLDELSNEAINKVPTNFNNNIVWNYGHIIVSGYSLTYVVTGVEPNITIPLADKYRKGTKPTTVASQEEIEELKAISVAYLQKVESDIAANKFDNIQVYTTQTFGLPMRTIEEVLTNIAGHDISHFSTAMALKKLV